MDENITIEQEICEHRTNTNLLEEERLNKIANIKTDIEERYKRLQEKNRRPSLEYVSTEDIKYVFSKYVEEKELQDINEQELKKLFDEWFKNYKNNL